MNENPDMQLYFPFRGICRACLQRKFFLDVKHSFCTGCMTDYIRIKKKENPGGII